MIHRRDLLQIGGLSMLGLTLPELFRLQAITAAAAAGDGAGRNPAAKQRANSCVFLFLFGGPSHIDLWDMKPDAPAEIRGEFQPVATARARHPGLRAPAAAWRGTMDKVCLLRSMTHRMNVHGPACSEVFSGREYFGPPTTDQASREDWPSLSSLVMRYGTPHGGLPPSVVLPWYLQFPGQAERIAGQTGGRMGERYNAFLLQGDLGRADFELEGLQPDRRRAARPPAPAAATCSTGCAAAAVRRPPASRSTATAGSVYALLEQPGQRGASTCAASRRPSASATARRRSARACCWPAGWSRRACRWSRSTGRTRRRSTASTPAGTRTRTTSPS